MLPPKIIPAEVLPQLPWTYFFIAVLSIQNSVNHQDIRWFDDFGIAACPPSPSARPRRLARLGRAPVLQWEIPFPRNNSLIFAINFRFAVI